MPVLLSGAPESCHCRAAVERGDAIEHFHLPGKADAGMFRSERQDSDLMPTGVAAILRAGDTIRDPEFDAIYTPDLRLRSGKHWTPVNVAIRAARLLTEIGSTRVLDVGAGPGKFCIIGALTTSAHFTGIDKRERLVEAAQMAARRVGADTNAHFVCANVLDFGFRSFDGIYLYNPFHEQIAVDSMPIDETIQLSPDLYRAYVVCTVAKLARAPAGTAVVTYHGFGGPMPSEYRRVHREDIGSDELVLWVKGRRQKRQPGRRPLTSRLSIGRAGRISKRRVADA